MADIDPSHSLLRWVPKTKLRFDPETNEPIGPQPIAFRLRIEQTPPEPYLSVSWVEHTPGTPDEQIAATAKLLAVQVNTTPAKGGAFAVGVVADVKEACKTQSNVDVKIVSTPTKKSPAYAQVWGIPADDLPLQTSLAFGCWSSIKKAADIL